MNRSLLKNILLGILVGLIAAGSWLGYRQFRTTQQKDDRVGIKLLAEVMALVKEKYVEKVEEKNLVKSAIEGMLAALDPHSAYLTPDSFKEMKVSMSGSFGGLGIEISMRDNKLTVVSPIEDTPAFRAGIKSNDHIWKINDKLTKGMSITEAVGMMRGPKGTPVTLTILREGSGRPLVFPLLRDIIKTRSLRARTLEPGYGYVRISQFQERTGEDFVQALTRLRAENGGSLKGLVLDLRYNPGGLIDTAVQVAGRFVGEGFTNGLIVYTQGRDPASKKMLSASIGEKEPHYPMVVLINGGSASASEIVAGALQDHKRAIIMGTPSFGKGSVQSIMPLKQNSGLKLTTARYYTPNGRSIQAKGIVPDIIVGQLDRTAPGAKEKTGAEKKEFREENLENHLGGVPGGQQQPAVPHGLPAKPVKDSPPLPGGGAKKPSEEKGKDGVKPAASPHDPALADDYQLARAVDLLKGLQLIEMLKEGAAVKPGTPVQGAATSAAK